MPTHSGHNQAPVNFNTMVSYAQRHVIPDKSAPLRHDPWDDLQKHYGQMDCQRQIVV